jgi:hypothetical protein
MAPPQGGVFHCVEWALLLAAFDLDSALDLDFASSWRSPSALPKNS